MGGQPVKPGSTPPNPNPAPGGNKATPAKPTGPMPGQNPYQPFENDRLNWLTADKEAAAPAISRLGGTKPSLILFIGSGDKDHCCARAFERAVFKDQTVVTFAKDNFITVRLDRESDIAKQFEIKRPSLVILDSEGEEVARFIDCTEPRWVVPIFEECTKRSKEIKARTTEWTPRIARAELFADEGKTKDAAAIVAKALRIERLSRSTKEKLGRVAKSLDDKAQARLDAAKANEPSDVIAAWVEYRSIRDDYWALPASARAKTAIAAIEKDPANKDKLKAARDAEAKGKPATDGTKSEPKAPAKPDAEPPMPVPAPRPEDPTPRSSEDE